MAFIGIPLAIVISLLWYLPGIRAQGENRRLRRKDYWLIALVYGFLYACLLIIATEIAWDAIIGTPKEGDLAGNILADFFRAALLEEFFKFTGFLLARQRFNPERKIDFIMIAGLIGLVYGVVEKAVLGNVAAVIVGLLFPMHIMWQFNQGGHWFEYERAKARKDTRRARREWCLAIFVPFLLHGCWDSALDIITCCVGRESTWMQAFGGVLMVAALAWAAVYTVRTIKKVCRTAREASTAEA